MIDRPHPHYTEFPDPELANKHGFLAHGGSLDVHTLLSAYQQGIFPWFNDNEPILWWSPDPRMIMPTAEIHTSRSLKKIIKNKKFKITCGQNFEQVIEACSQPRHPEGSFNITYEQPQTWLTTDMKKAYVELHHAGFAQSIECWQNNKLVGGLYGVTIAGMYFGESMFSKENNSSKVALVALCQFLQSQGIQWIDCQVESQHLLSLGAININRKEFLEKIQHQLTHPLEINWHDFSSFPKQSLLT